MSDVNKPMSGDAGATEGSVDAAPVTVDPLAAMTAERDKYKDAALRALADLDNYRKRAVRERDEVAKKSREDLLRELLPVFDNLERAQQFVAQGADASAIGKGVEMVLKLFEDTLVRLGGKRLRPVGEPFDPQVHEAIGQQPSDKPAGTVAAEAVPGYLLNDRLLRASMVVVSLGPATAAATATAPSNSKPAEEEQLEFDPSKG